MSADVFLMGTAGNFNDPNRSMWREPIKQALDKLGVSYFDPVVPVWTEELGKKEVEALLNAKILVMAVMPNTAGIASLAESGWAVLSAIMRKQQVGIFVDANYKEAPVDSTKSTQAIRRDTLINSGTETVEDASRRARKLVVSHARRITLQFPDVQLYVAKDLFDLTDWTVKTARELRSRKKFLGIF